MSSATRAATVALAIAWAYARAAGQSVGDAQTVTGFRVPSYDREGRMTSQVFGDTARIRADGSVDIVELRVEFYGNEDLAATNRAVEMRITSPRCIYHRASGVVTSDASVRIARENMIVTGEGFQWIGPAERLEIYRNAKVVLKDAKRSIRMESKP
jgi:hypothetical protein